MQREIFPLSDLWQIADRCICSGALKAIQIGPYADLESKAITQCVDCGQGWKVTVFKERIDLQNANCKRSEIPATQDWDGIECPECQCSFTEISWDERHSEGLFEVHEQCCRSPFCPDRPDPIEPPNSAGCVR